MSDWTPYLPTSYDGLSPVHWHKADEGTWQDDGVTPANSDGHVVGRWDDLANNDHVSQAVVADKPLYISGVINGEPAILFGGGFAHGDHLQGHFTNGGDVSPPYTVFIVAQLDAGEVNDNNSNYLLYSDDATNYVYCLAYSGDTPDSWGFGDTGGFIHDGEDNSDWNIWSVLSDAPNSELWHNGESIVAGASPGVTPLEGITIGARRDGSITWKGYVAEVIIYADVLSVPDMDQVGTYLSDRYDIGYTRLGGNDLVTGPPVLGTPALGNIGIDPLSADDLATGAPILGHWKPSYGTDEDGLTPVIWLRADLGIVLYPDTDRVYQWHNQGDAGDYFYNAYNPAVLPLFCDDPEDQMKGNPVVRGDGKNLRNSDNFGLDGETDLTAFLATNNHLWSGGSLPCSVLQIGRYHTLYGGSNHAIQWGRDYTLGPRVWYPGSTSGGEYYDPATDDWSTPHILMWQREADDLWPEGEFYQDGFEVTTSGSVNPTMGPLDLINDDYKFRETLVFSGYYAGGAGERAQIDIAEAIVYDAVLSEADREQVEGYLSLRYLELVYDLEADDLVSGVPVLGAPGIYVNPQETDDLLTGVPDLGHPTLRTPSIYIDGVDKTGTFISSERIDEYCNPGIRVTLDFTEKFDVDTWEGVVLFEDGVKVFTGTVSRVESNRKEQKTFTVQAKDDIRRLREYFVVEEYVSAGESVQHWITLIAGLAGCTPTFLDFFAGSRGTLSSMTMGRMHAYEIIDELLLYSGMDIWCDENNNMFVGTRMDADLTASPIAAGDNLSSFARARDSEPCRNVAKVYTVLGTAVAQSVEDWQIDEDDLRTMVVSSVYLDSVVAGEDLARRMVEAAAPEYDIKRAILDGIEPEREVGDHVAFDDGEDNAGSGRITSITSMKTGEPPIGEMHITLDERCPKVGAGGLYGPDGRDVTVGTYDRGVWRCKDIWASYPHWEPMNTGLTSTLYFEGVNLGSTFGVDWFIRDPYYPSNMAFLLTQAGLMQTTSLEPGYENWTPVLMNSHIGVFMGDSWANWQRWHIVKIRSTVASEGKYFIAATRTSDLFGFKQAFVGMTTQRFANFSNCLTPWGPGIYAYSPGAEQCGVSIPYRTCMLWGNHPDNYSYEKYASLGSWHRGAGDNSGGFAGWHRHGNGCSISGPVSGFSSNGGPERWNCYESIDPDTGIIELHTPFDESKLTGSSPPGPCTCVRRGPTSNGKFEEYVASTGCFQYYWGGGPDGLNGVQPALHIPYNQVHNGDGSPSKIFYHPGWIQRDGKQYPSLNQLGPIVLPWDVCNSLQGSFATHSSDISKMYAFSPGATTRFAISDDGGDNWEEMTTIPVQTACYSGFPTSSNKVYAGAHPDLGFYSNKKLIYSSWDRGETWTDVTGDLWNESVRIYGGGPSGIVTIAPRYSK